MDDFATFVESLDAITLFEDFKNSLRESGDLTYSTSSSSSSDADFDDDDSEHDDHWRVQSDEDPAVEQLGKPIDNERFVCPIDTVGPDGAGSAPWDGNEWDSPGGIISQLAPLEPTFRPPKPRRSSFSSASSKEEDMRRKLRAEAKNDPSYLVHRTPKAQSYSSDSERRDLFRALLLKCESGTAGRTRSSKSKSKSENAPPPSGSTSPSSSFPTNSTATTGNKSTRFITHRLRDDLLYHEGNIPPVLWCLCTTGAWYPQFESLQRHLVRAHGVSPSPTDEHPCPWPECEKHYVSLNALSNHYKQCHFFIGHKCDFCDVVVKTAYGKRKHQEAKHKDRL
ncbi:hypothetical protein V5O48_006195 [Marasmius crinis-equi]|uniref:C2H2-type domain-containing protein n=1 Tax=Marasmius crinis-equi TaxID=585013 RepID=A0ABR3FK60_9AGAR